MNAKRYATKDMTITKSNSSYGNWALRISDTEVKFFMRKQDALDALVSFAKYETLSGTMNLGD